MKTFGKAPFMVSSGHGCRTFGGVLLLGIGDPRAWCVPEVGVSFRVCYFICAVSRCNRHNFVVVALSILLSYTLYYTSFFHVLLTLASTTHAYNNNSPDSNTTAKMTEKAAEPRNSTMDVESGREGISHWKMILDQGVVTNEIVNWEYEGSGTEEDPYAVEWP